jgi:hypothetical protein
MAISKQIGGEKSAREDKGHGNHSMQSAVTGSHRKVIEFYSII